MGKRRSPRAQPITESDKRYIEEAIAAEQYDYDLESEPYIRLAIEAEHYTRLWYRVESWAFEVLRWDNPTVWGGQFGKESPRMVRVRAQLNKIRDLDNEEEAERYGLPIAELEGWLGTVRAPTRREAGHRRVLIRILTWVKDLDYGGVHSPEWIPIGGIGGAGTMSVRAAQLGALRWAKSYADSLMSFTASRDLVMTAIEIDWYTTPNTPSPTTGLPPQSQL